MLLHNMYGIPVFGTNICGHLPLKTGSYGELCSCWTALGVFFPVFQNSRLWKIEKTVRKTAQLVNIQGVSLNESQIVPAKSMYRTEKYILASISAQMSHYEN